MLSERLSHSNLGDVLRSRNVSKASLRVSREDAPSWKLSILRRGAAGKQAASGRRAAHANGSGAVQTPRRAAAPRAPLRSGPAAPSGPLATRRAPRRTRRARASGRAGELASCWPGARPRGCRPAAAGCAAQLARSPRCPLASGSRGIGSGCRESTRCRHGRVPDRRGNARGPAARRRGIAAGPQATAPARTGALRRAGWLASGPCAQAGAKLARGAARAGRETGGGARSDHSPRSPSARGRGARPGATPATQPFRALRSSNREAGRGARRGPHLCELRPPGRCVPSAGRVARGSGGHVRRSWGRCTGRASGAIRRLETRSIRGCGSAARERGAGGASSWAGRGWGERVVR